MVKLNCNSASYWSGAKKPREIARGKSSSGLKDQASGHGN